MDHSHFDLAALQREGVGGVEIKYAWAPARQRGERGSFGTAQKASRWKTTRGWFGLIPSTSRNHPLPLARREERSASRFVLGTEAQRILSSAVLKPSRIWEQAAGEQRPAPLTSGILRRSDDTHHDLPSRRAVRPRHGSTGWRRDTATGLSSRRPGCRATFRSVRL